MAGGLLLIAAALLLTVYNLWDEHRAGTAVTQVMEQLQKQTPDSMLVQTPSSPAGPGESEIPDYILNPDMEMPTMDIDGNRYIQMLSHWSLYVLHNSSHCSSHQTEPWHYSRQRDPE